jgi:hypothetical protein
MGERECRKHQCAKGGVVVGGECGGGGEEGGVSKKRGCKVQGGRE